MANLRQELLYKYKNFAELAYAAVVGKHNGTGSTPDLSYKVIFADSPSLAADTETDIWPHPSGSMAIPTSAETLSIVSSSTEDDAGGTGTDAVYIEGLDSSYNPQSELVILDGTTPVLSTKSYIHVAEVNCLNVTTSGTKNVGNISLTQSSSGGRMGYVVAGDSLSKHGQFLVPAGYNAIMLNGMISVYRTSGTGDRRVQSDLHITPLNGGAGDRIEYQTIKVGASSSAGVSEMIFHIPLVVAAKHLIVPKVIAEAINTRCSVTYSILLIKETVDIDTIF